MTSSQNGYPANDPSLIVTVAVPGSKVKLRVRKGAAGQVLTEYASLFDSRVEDIDTAGSDLGDPIPAIAGAGPSRLADDWGYAERNVRGSGDQVSNHASGTAIDLNATQHPLGVKGTYTAIQLAALHALLREFIDPLSGDSVLRAGEDYVNRKDGMHVEIVANQAAVARALAAYRQRHAVKPVAKPIVKPVVAVPVTLPVTPPVVPASPGSPWSRVIRPPV
jgi:hypothetical protein